MVGRTRIDACGRGHPRTEENTRTEANGKRHCRICERITHIARPYMRKTGAMPVRPYRHWTTGDIAKLTALYPTTKTRDLAKMLGRSMNVVHAYAHRLGLRKVKGSRALTMGACRGEGWESPTVPDEISRPATAARHEG